MPDFSGLADKNEMSANIFDTRGQWAALIMDLQSGVGQLKNYLALVLQKDINPSLLPKIESFQNLLLNKDAAIAILRHDIATNTVFDSEQSHRVGDNSSEQKLLNGILQMKEELQRMKSQLEDIETEAQLQKNKQP